MLFVSVPSAPSYPIIFTENAFDEICKHIKKGQRIAVITDTVVQKKYGKYIAEMRGQCSLELFAFEAKEKYKTLATVEKITRALQEQKFSRKNTLIVALGGGIIGDVAGFVASIYLRGVPYIQVPTTLLSMVDSSIGGKTGVNTRYGKNLIGSFYHPEAVIIAPFFLKTLSEEEISNGLAEMIKHAVLDSENHLKSLDRSVNKIFERDQKTCVRMIKKSIEVKKRYVEEDEKEHSGVRAALNFGHTIGHAIEKASNHTVAHGSAIAIGMIMECVLAKKEFGFEGAEKIKALLEKSRLPTALPKNIHAEHLERFIAQDKKKEGQKIVYALPKDFGEIELKAF